MSYANDGQVPAEDLRQGDELMPDTQGEDPIDAELGPDGQGDILPEDEPSMPDPADPNAPMSPDAPTQPGQPIDPGQPIEPGQPIDPGGPAEPQIPTPDEPLAPNPAEPLAPNPEEPTFP